MNSIFLFSNQEFCLVPGLSFGRLSNIINENYKPDVGGIHERFFNLEIHYMGSLKRDVDKKEDSVKISLIAFVEHILYGAWIVGKMSHYGRFIWWRI